MKRSLINTAILGTLGLGAVFTVSAQQANTQTAEIELCAGEYTIPAGTMGNIDPIVMWGYSIGQPQGNTCAAPKSPGPSILLPKNTEDSPTVYDLKIKLYNTLPRATSLVIPGLIKPMTPVMFTPPGETIPRVHSFDTEVAPGGSATYSWTGVKQGAYLYQSGTHQQVQVQMGLVGAIMSDAFTGTAATAAYPGLEYTNLYPLIYSEIDPVIHANVADTTTLPNYDLNDMQSTIDYAPKYFGVTLDTSTSCPEDPWCTQTNRLSTFEGSNPSLSVANGDTPLVRLFNGSTRIHTPTLIGATFDIIAEDGHLYPNYRKQYAVALPPLKTKDALLDTSAVGPAGAFIKLIDSAMNLSNPAPNLYRYAAGQAEDGTIANGEGEVFASFKVAAATNYVAPSFSEGNTPVARRDEARVSEGGSITIDVLANDDVNGATPEILKSPNHGTLTKSVSGSGWEYSHSGDESSSDSFLYKLVKAGESWTPMAGVKIAVDAQNDAPVAVDDNVAMKVGQQMEIRVLDNDKDVDSRDLRVSAVNSSNYLLGAVSFVDKAVTVSGDEVGSGTVVYTVDDGKGGTDTATINITVAAAGTGDGQYTGGDNTTPSDDSVVNVPSPIAKDDTFAVAEGGTYDVTGNLILSVLANDISNGGKVTMDEYPEHGAIDMNEDGTFKYIHDGSEEKEDRFSYSVFNQGGSDKAEVKVIVAAKMDAPRVNDDRARAKVNQSVVIDILDNDKDRDSEIEKARIEIVADRGPSHGVVSMGPGRKVTYTPVADFSGRDSFEYQLYDDVTGEASRRKAKVSIRVK